MKISIHVESRFEHHRYWCSLFAAGLRAHGHHPNMVEGFHPTECDLAVFWSHHPRTLAIRQRQMAAGADYLVMERGYIGDRKKWTSLGFNGQNGRADFLNENSPSDRWDRYPSWNEKPWHPGSDYILLIGQVPTDSAVGHIDFKSWVVNTIKHLKQITDLPIEYRPHPIAQGRHLSHKYEKAELIDEISRAAAVVTFNSTAGVDAVMDGIPVIAMDEGSMAWPMAGHDLVDVLDPPMPDRTQWLQDLAYCQWNKKEISSGKAWDHLKNKTENKCEPAD